MTRQPILTCISIFKFIFTEHVFKGKSIKSVIKRIKIKDKFPQPPCKNSAPSSSDEELFLTRIEKSKQNITSPLESDSESGVLRKFSISSSE